MSTTTNNTIDTKTYIANNEDELLILLLRNKTATFSHVALEQVMDWVNDLYSMFQRKTLMRGIMLYLSWRWYTLCCWQQLVII